MTGGQPKSLRLSVDPQSVTAARTHLRTMVQGNPIAEAAVEGFNDWEVIEAMERLWAVGMSDREPFRPPESPSHDSIGLPRQT